MPKPFHLHMERVAAKVDLPRSRESRISLILQSTWESSEVHATACRPRNHGVKMLHGVSADHQLQQINVRRKWRAFKPLRADVSQ